MSEKTSNSSVTGGARAKEPKHPVPLPTLPNDENARVIHMIGYLRSDCVVLKDRTSIEFLNKKGFLGKVAAPENDPLLTQTEHQDENDLEDKKGCSSTRCGITLRSGDALTGLNYPLPTQKLRQVEKDLEDEVNLRTGSWRHEMKKSTGSRSSDSSSDLTERDLISYDPEEITFEEGFLGKVAAPENDPLLTQTEHQDENDLEDKKGCSSTRCGITLRSGDALTGLNYPLPTQKLRQVEKDLEDEVNLRTGSWRHEMKKSTGSRSSDSLSDLTERDLISYDPEEITFEEAFFLTSELACLDVEDDGVFMNLIQMWDKYNKLAIDRTSHITYAAYHHFRSKNWIVRCDFKVDVDYVLYRSGPPFNNPPYAIIVKDGEMMVNKEVRKERKSDLHNSLSLYRKNKERGMALIYCYVIEEECAKKVTTKMHSTYKMKEILVEDVLENKLIEH